MKKKFALKRLPPQTRVYLPEEGNTIDVLTLDTTLILDAPTLERGQVLTREELHQDINDNSHNTDDVQIHDDVIIQEDAHRLTTGHTEDISQGTGLHPGVVTGMRTSKTLRTQRARTL